MVKTSKARKSGTSRRAATRAIDLRQADRMATAASRVVEARQVIGSLTAEARAAGRTSLVLALNYVFGRLLVAERSCREATQGTCANVQAEAVATGRRPPPAPAIEPDDIPF